MSLFVLQAHFGGPDYYVEYCYNEVVPVNKRIAVTEHAFTAEELQVAHGFNLLGMVETQEEVEALVNPPVRNVDEDTVMVKPEPELVDVAGRPFTAKEEKLVDLDVSRPASLNVPWFSPMQIKKKSKKEKRASQ